MNWTVQTEMLYFYLFITLNNARKITASWLLEYNSEEYHYSLKNLTPEEHQSVAENVETSNLSVYYNTSTDMY
ncbi:transposase [Citrobacter sp. JGM124]|nr:transposase [Citrobacter sp. JGM124]